MVKPAIISTSITMLQTVCQFIWLVLIAKFYSISDVGNYSLINSIILPISILFSFGIRQAYVLNHHKIGYKTFFYLRFLGFIPSSLISFTIIAILDSGLLVEFSSLFLIRLINMKMELDIAVYQVRKRLNAVFFHQFFRYVSATIALYIICISNIAFDMSLILFSLSYLAVYICFELRNTVEMIREDDKNLAIRSCYKSYFLLSLSNFTNSFQSNLSRVFLGILGSSALLGIFSISFQLYSVAQMIFTQILNFYLKGISNKKESRKVLIKVLGFAFLYSVIAIFCWLICGQFFIDYALTGEYREIYYWVSILLIFLLIRNLGYAFNWMLINNGKYRDIAKYNSIVLFFSVIVNFFMIYLYELQGAYYAIGTIAIIYTLTMVTIYAKKIV